MKKKLKRRQEFEDYERVVMDEVITFGTTLYIRKDRRALKIVFPAGQIVLFAPEEELKKFHAPECTNAVCICGKGFFGTVEN